MRQDFAKFLKGNAEAIELNVSLYQIAHLWDDLIDKDREVPDQEVNQALYAALIGIPRNRFYQEHFALLNPLLEASILDWLAANEIEKSRDAEKLRQSYVMRFTVMSLTVMCARIIGGVEWANKVNAEFRAMAAPWSEYISGLGIKDGVD